MKNAAKKLMAMLLTMLIVSFLAFLAFQVLTGDPATAILGTSATPERVAALREELGLNAPLLVRYGRWLAGFVTGDMGMSYSYSLSVGQLIGEKLPHTLALTLLAFALIALVSVPLGLMSVQRHGGLLDKLLTVSNQILMAVPPFFTGLLFTWLFGVGIRIFGVHTQLFQPGRLPDFAADPWGYWGYLIFPALSLALPRIAMTVRMLRSTLLAELHREYIRTAISRGGSEQTILYLHALKNALPPVITFLAQTLAEIVAGGIVVEQVFSIPGLGRLLVSSIAGRDFPVVQAIVVVLALWVVLAGTLADLINSRIDPRLRLGGAV